MLRRTDWGPKLLLGSLVISSFISHGNGDGLFGKCGVISYKKKGNCEKSLSTHSNEGKRVVSECTVDVIPWFAYITVEPIKRSKGEIKSCGGVFLNKFWVLTAAHCLCNSAFPCKLNRKTMKMELDYNIKKTHFIHLPSRVRPNGRGAGGRRSIFRVEEYKIHHFYRTDETKTKKQSGHDFALLRLDYPIADNVYGIGAFANYSEKLMPICIPPEPLSIKDEDQHATTVGFGLVRDKKCSTTDEGPAAFQACNKKWKNKNKELTMQTTSSRLKTLNCIHKDPPSTWNKQCVNFREHMEDLPKQKFSSMTVEDMALLKAKDDLLEEVILVPEEELTNRRKNFNKVHCFSTKESDFGWCAVCNKNAPKGDPTACEDGDVAVPTAGTNWGLCTETCRKSQFNTGEDIGLADVFILNNDLCKAYIEKIDKNKKVKVDFSETSEICAVFLRNVTKTVVSYAKQGNKFTYKVQDDPDIVDNPEFRSIRLKNSFLEDKGMIIGGVDTCKGDSGGPLWVEEEHYLNGPNLQKTAILVGIVSRGSGCGGFNSPGVYGRVKEIYGWLDRYTKKDYTYTKKGDFGHVKGKYSVETGDSRKLSPLWDDNPRVPEEEAKLRSTKKEKRAKSKKSKHKKKKGHKKRKKKRGRKKRKKSKRKKKKKKRKRRKKSR